MSTDKKMWEQWKDWRLESEKFEDYTNEEKETINEALTDKLQTPSDVSYYKRDWSKVFESWGDVDYGPRESDMYDWNGRANYQAATKEFHTHMSKIAKKLNSVVGELEGSWKVWRKILKKHRNNDGS
jgi:hypothetical protein